MTTVGQEMKAWREAREAPKSGSATGAISSDDIRQFIPKIPTRALDEGHDVKDTLDHLEGARVALSTMGKAWPALEQVARWSDLPEAKVFAKQMSDKVHALSKEINDWMHDHHDVLHPKR